MFKYFSKDARQRRKFDKLFPNFAKTDLIFPRNTYLNVFVFGSNLAGQHIGGAALAAKELYQAQDGVCVGPTGNAYAIPTMDYELRPLDLRFIEGFVSNFLEEVKRNPHVTYHLTPIGTGICKYKVDNVAWMFIKGITYKNLIFPKQFKEYFYKIYLAGGLNESAK